MNQMVAAIAEPAEAEIILAYEVEVRAIGPAELLSDDGRAALQELMDRAKTAALGVLDGTGAAPLPASLAARMQIAIERWDALAKAEKAADRDDLAGGSAEEADAAEAYQKAKYAFEDAFNILISRFEKEFPHGSR